jgi:hypothetical protein
MSQQQVDQVIKVALTPLAEAEKPYVLAFSRENGSRKIGMDLKYLCQIVLESCLDQSMELFVGRRFATAENALAFARAHATLEDGMWVFGS